MAARVTIQDIADALGLSRNTVSKAINNTGILADATRERILHKAVEMGYKQFSYVNVHETGSATLKLSPEEKTGPPEHGGVISVLTACTIDSSHFASTMLDRIQREFSEFGYSFMMHRVTEEDYQKKQLPASVNRELTTAFLCIEVFDMGYARYLCSLGIPILFVDAPSDTVKKKLNADILIMDNRTELISFIAKMRKKGLSKFGFIGDIHHCRSFFERYLAMIDGMMISGLPPADRYSIRTSPGGKSYPEQNEYRSFLIDSLRKMDELPELFLCANDFIAIDALFAFKELGIRVPEDVLLCGFDDSQESRILTPPLTTVHIHSQTMGSSAVQMLLSQIREPGSNFRTIVTETSLILRESTGD